MPAIEPVLSGLASVSLWMTLIVPGSARIAGGRELKRVLQCLLVVCDQLAAQQRVYQTIDITALFLGTGEQRLEHVLCQWTGR